MKQCDKCQCNDCLKNTSEYECSGCMNCIGLETECDRKITMEDFLHEENLYYKKIYNHFKRSKGPNNQWWKLLEEAGELIVELSKSKNDFTDAKVIEECVDYYIIGRQLLGDDYEYSPNTQLSHPLYDSLTAPPLVRFRNSSIDEIMGNHCLENVINRLMKSIIEADRLEMFNLILFSKVMRTLKRINEKYYEEVF